jgi:hypothetical protein
VRTRPAGQLLWQRPDLPQSDAVLHRLREGLGRQLALVIAAEAEERGGVEEGRELSGQWEAVRDVEQRIIERLLALAREFRPKTTRPRRQREESAAEGARYTLRELVELGVPIGAYLRGLRG